MKFKVLKALIASLALAVSSFANASLIEIDQGGAFSDYLPNIMGTGRGVSFIANNDFSITSIGADLDVLSHVTNFLYEFEIYSSADGTTADALLHNVTFNLAVGQGWRDISTSFNFLAGSHYVLNFARVDDMWIDGISTKFSLLPIAHNYGDLTTVTTFVNANPAAVNPLGMHFRLQTGSAISTPVSEPSTLVILALGLMGVAARRKRLF